VTEVDNLAVGGGFFEVSSTHGGSPLNGPIVRMANVSDNVAANSE
jgi:hypothetical protein